ncbi:MAG: alkaline phosphatase family protein, partial [Chthoniobacterales bacterium]
AAAKHAKHVVLIVWDGMRPDFVTESGTPNLWKMAQEGVTFRQNHSFYPSVTNVNGTVFATGVFPNRSGLIANNEYRPAINRVAFVDTAVEETTRKGDEISGGKYLSVPTIVELLRASGRHTAVAGTKWIAALFDRATDRSSNIAKHSPVLTDGKAMPENWQRALLDSLGDFPKKTLPNEAQDEWTTSALTRVFWKDGVPDFSLLWLSDPDFTEHDGAPGSPAALAGVKNSDAMLGKVLAALDGKHLREDTDVFVVSDHGFSTVENANDLPAMLIAAGFNATKKFEGEAEPGSIFVAGNAGTVLFYVIGHNQDVARRLVSWLQQSSCAGVIFTREKMEGTFAIADAHLEKENGPDVIMSFRWDEKPNEFGTPGMIDADWNRAPGKGTHATLSKFDLHNTLIAAGPDFRRDYRSEVASGNIDVAATILHILDVAPLVPLDGRILSEAMTDGPAEPSEVETRTVEASRDVATGHWRQYLKISRVAGHDYFDEGNGGLTSPSTR